MPQVAERPAGSGQDAWSKDPTIPRVVTLEPAYGGFFRRWTKFPDGSETEQIVRADGSEVIDSGGGIKSASAASNPNPGPSTALGADGAARRFAEAHAGTLCHDGAGWHAFDGTIWRRQRQGVTPQVRSLLRESGHDDPWPGLVAAVEQLARTEPALAADTSPDAATPWDAGTLWDRDPWRLGTPGGTVDLATGALRPADPRDRITRATAVAPAPTSDCPLWRRFLQEAMGETAGGDTALQTFLQRFLGYALTGETCEHLALFGLGEGGNGKSVFLNMIREIFGSYAAVAAPDLLTQGAGWRAHPGSTGSSAHSTEIAMLAGARLVTASETEEGRTWAEGRFKLLTGGDPVTARRLGRDPFTFTPRFKLIVVGNHLPQLRTVDAALRRRLCVVPFAHQPAVPDRRLEARLREEAPAILRWMIEGCSAWARDLNGEGPDGGMCRPGAVVTATDSYFAGQDLVGQFLAERCDRTPTCLETAADLYTAWCAFAEAIGEPPGSQRGLALRLARYGLVREHQRHARVYRGVRLIREGELIAEVREARGGCCIA